MNASDNQMPEAIGQGNKNPDLYEALKSISLLCDKHSVTKVAKFLAGFSEFKTIHRATVFRWIKNEKNPFHKDTERRIKDAADLLKGFKGDMPRIRIGVIKGASEYFPIFLAKKLSEEKESEIEVEFVEKNYVAECFDALNKDNVDLIIAPREELIGSEDSKIQRICKIEEVPVAGIFPGEHFTYESLAKKLRDCIKGPTPFAIGCLVNANYKSIVERLVGEFPQAPEFVHIRDYKEAISLFKENKIQAAVGHTIFIANCFHYIKREKVSPRSAWPSDIQNLYVFDREFRRLKIDLFTNVSGSRTHLLRMALGLIYKAIKAINSQKDSNIRKLAQVVDEELKLEEAPAKSGKDILNEFNFCMETFNAHLLFDCHIWE